MKSKKAFSLIEIIVATSILSIAVFGVYKLIGENTKIIGNSQNYVSVYKLFPALSECIDYIGFDTFKGSTNTNYEFDFGITGTGCTIGGNQYKQDNIDYILEGVITGSGSSFINWDLSITSDDTGKITQSYTQKK